MVLLVTSDNEQFHADKDVVERSVLIKNMLEGEPLHSLKSAMTCMPRPCLMFYARCRRIRPADTFAERFVQRPQEGW